jgi:hypothetical protein
VGRRAEAAAAIFGTALAVALHLTFFVHAGGLWRDELNSVQLATLGSLAEIWAHLEFDSIPLLPVFVLRAWSALAGTSDLALRSLGLGVGLLGLACLWLNSRVFRSGAPLLSVALVGLNPYVIARGDSIRGYGLGIALILLVFALVWRLVERPSLGRWLAATLAAVLAVHAVYHNALLVFATCAAACAVCARGRHWSGVLRVLALGAVAAFTVALYVPVFERSRIWAPMFQYPELWRGFRLDWFLANLGAALTPFPWLWAGLYAGALVAAAVALVRPAAAKLERREADVALYAAVAATVALPAYYLFLQRLGYVTQVWYYIALLAFTGVALDVLLSLLARAPWLRVLRIGAALGLMAWAFFPALSQARTRLTNVDLLASRLGRLASPGDAILVSPWYCGITFARYYRGAAAWSTVPPIADHRDHRVDLLLEHMTAPDQTAPVRAPLELARASLQHGDRVWLVGEFPLPGPGAKPPVLRPAPSEPSGWNDWPYIESWSMQVAHQLRSGALRFRTVAPRLPGPVSKHENLPLVVLEGWRGGHPPVGPAGGETGGSFPIERP